MKEQKKEKIDKTEIQALDRGVDFNKGTTASDCCKRAMAKIDP